MGNWLELKLNPPSCKIGIMIKPSYERINVAAETFDVNGDV